MDSNRCLARTLVLFVLTSLASSAQVVTLTYQGQYTSAIAGLFDGSPITRVEVDILYPLEGQTFNTVPDLFDYRGASVTEVRFGHGTPGATGELTSTYATFPITNGGAGTILVTDADVASLDTIWLIFTNGFQTATNYNGNKPLSLNVRLDFTSTNWIRGGMPLPLPPQGAFGGGTLKDFTIVSNGTPVTLPFASSRRFYVRPTNSASIASTDTWPSFTFTAEPWVRYQPEYAPTLSPSNWTRLGNPILSDTQQVVTVSDTNNASGQAFYRVSLAK